MNLRERWHGTSGGYSNHRCRCDECKRAWASAHRAYLDRHPEQRERARKRAQAWKRANPDKARAYDRRRREKARANPDKARAYDRRRREKVRATRRAAAVERVAAALRHWGMSAEKATEAAPFVLDSALRKEQP